MISSARLFYRDYWLQFWILVYLNLADFAITRHFYNLIGPSAEATPWLRHMIERHGINSILTWKVTGLVSLFILLSFFHLKQLIFLDASAGASNRRANVGKVVFFANIWYTAVVLWGLYGFIS